MTELDRRAGRRPCRSHADARASALWREYFDGEPPGYSRGYLVRGSATGYRN